MRSNTGQGKDGDSEGDLHSKEPEEELAVPPLLGEVPSSKELEVLDRLDLELELLLVHSDDFLWVKHSKTDHTMLSALVEDETVQ